MDWDKCNFKKINQRKAESRRWQDRESTPGKKTSAKGSHRPASKKKKRGKR